MTEREALERIAAYLNSDWPEQYQQPILIACAALTESRAETLYRAEWDHIHHVLAEQNGNVTQAARRLRIDRRTLQRRLQKNPPRTL